MEDLAGLLARMEQLLADMEELDEPTRAKVFELLDGIDTVHRMALTRLAEALDPELLSRSRADPTVEWLLDAYGIGVDQRAVAQSALEEIRPYIESHGGNLDVLDVSAGIVRVRMAGACAGCSASAITLQEGIERALRDNFPGFLRLEAEEDEEAESHAPPGPTLLQINRLEVRARRKP
ncbi:MAG: NifU family protein [Actinomycetota bacterium]